MSGNSIGTPMLGMPAYTEEMFQQGQTSRVPGMGEGSMPNMDGSMPGQGAMGMGAGSMPGMGGKGGMFNSNMLYSGSPAYNPGMGGMPSDAPPGTTLGFPMDNPQANVPQNPPMVPPQSGTPGRPVPVEPFTPAGPGLANPGGVGVIPGNQPPPPLQQAQPQRPPTLAQRQPNMPARLQSTPMQVRGPVNPPNAGRGPGVQKVRTVGAGRGGMIRR